MSRPPRKAKSKALISLHDGLDDNTPQCPPPLSQQLHTRSGILPQSVSLPQNGGRGLQRHRQAQTLPLSTKVPLPGGDQPHFHLTATEKDRSASVSSSELHGHSTNDIGTDNDSSSSSECRDDEESEDDVIVSDIYDEDNDIPPVDIPAQRSKNGRVWSREPPNHIGRRHGVNVPKHVNVDTLMNAFERYVTANMVELIVKETAGEISQNLSRKWHEISQPELYGYFGILYLTGSLKLGFVHTNDIRKYGPEHVKRVFSPRDKIPSF